MGVTVKVEGFKALEATMRDLRVPVAKAAAQRGMIRAAEPLVEMAAALAPKRERELSESVTASRKLSPSQARKHRRTVPAGRAGAEVFVGAGPLPQAHLQEFGTFKDVPQPFMRPSWDAMRGTVLRNIKDMVGDELEKSAARARRKNAARG